LQKKNKVEKAIDDFLIKIISQNYSIKKIIGIIIVFLIMIVILFFYYFNNYDKILFLVFQILIIIFLFISIKLVLNKYKRKRLLDNSKKKLEILKTEENFISLDKLKIDNKIKRQIIDSSNKSDGELVIGSFDESGNLFSPFGKLLSAQIKNISLSEFKERERISLDIVVIEGKILVKKDFRGRADRFITEWSSLCKLKGQVNVPSIYDVDEKNTILYKSYIIGNKIRDILINNGAKISDQDINALKKNGLDSQQINNAICLEVRKNIFNCFDKEFFDKLSKKIKIIHRHGITSFGLGVNNILIDNNCEPWFFDFEGANIFNNYKGFTYKYRCLQDNYTYRRYYTLSNY